MTAQKIRLLINSLILPNIATRQRDQEANAALEEYLRLNQLSVEAEESASREEFNLLAEREKLAELESSLEALKLELIQHRETATV
jgi:hypothetical protein